MRTLDDIIEIGLDLKAKLSLDMERVEVDEAFRLCCKGFDLSDPEQKRQAVFQYVLRYLTYERLFERLVSSNGPAEITVRGIEELPTPFAVDIITHS